MAAAIGHCVFTVAIQREVNTQRIQAIERVKTDAIFGLPFLDDRNVLFIEDISVAVNIVDVDNELRAYIIKQVRRFAARSRYPLKQWKLSPIDQASQGKWQEYTDAKEAMFFYTDTANAPWTIIKSDDKDRRLWG